MQSKQSKHIEAAISDATATGTLLCTIGVLIHSDDEQLAQHLAALLDQHVFDVAIVDIVVVVNAGMAMTIEYLQTVADEHPKIKVVVQPPGANRAEAINRMLAHAATDICVITHSDTLPHQTAVENLVGMFEDPTVGMVGAQKVMPDTPAYVVGLLNHLRLRLEHMVSLEIPRMREMVAFRKVFKGLPEEMPIDEAFVETMVVERGLSLRYAPGAIVYSAGPTSMRAFIAQRRRNHLARLHLKKKYGRMVKRRDRKSMAKVVLKELWGGLRLIWLLVVLAVLESWSRLLGWYDFAVSRNRHVVWDMAWSQKQNVQQARRTQTRD